MSLKLLTAATVAVLAVPCSIARAQVAVGVAAGYSAPMGDFGKVADAGYHVTGLMSVSAPLVPIGLRVEGSFSQFNYNSSFSSTSASARILSATANAVFSSPGVVAPYVIGGLGIYNASASCSGCSSSSSSKVGYNGGAGFRFGLGGMSAFLEARYHYVPGGSNATTGGAKSSTQFIPISFGLTF
jgi:hypothetical protein